MFPQGVPGERGRVEVDVGVAARRPEPRVQVPLAIVALAPPDFPLLGDASPRVVVRASRPSASKVHVEQLRFTSQQEARILPGLDASQPSRVRDTAMLALDTGAPFLDVVLVHGTPLKPWEMDRQALIPVLEPFMEELHGAFLLYPDVPGPTTVGRSGGEDSEETWVRLRRFVRIHGRGWSERYQIALLDSGPLDDPKTREHLSRLSGVDVMLTAWEGSVADQRRHGWRCGGAVIAGMVLGFGNSIYRGPTGNRIDLPGGRRVASTPRFEASRMVDHSQWTDEVCVLSLEKGGRRARVLSEPCLRRPTGTWGFAALRTAKLIHRRIVEAAQQVVFKPANDAHAFALITAIDTAIRPFVKHGLLIGPSGDRTPEMSADVVRDPNAPGLVATIEGQLRPWCTTVKLSVEVRDGGRVGMEVQA